MEGVAHGVWIKDARTSDFSGYPLALSDEWNSLWWMVGVQGGLLDSAWLLESPENDAFASSAFAFGAPSSFFNEVWRPRHDADPGASPPRGRVVVLLRHRGG
jgi:hypothetical protein